MFSSVELVSGDYVKTQGEFTEYYIYDSFTGWFGTLDSLSNDVSYKLHVSKADQNVVITGLAIELPKVVSLKQGWNYLAYPYPIEASLGDVAPRGNFSSGDSLKSQVSFADYYGEQNIWFGPMAVMTPGRGYMIRVADNMNANFAAP